MLPRQTDSRLDIYIRKYGCYFMSLAYHTGRDFTPERLNHIWADCIKRGFISGDKNGDGDLDDNGEAIIVNPNGVCRMLGLDYTYMDRHFPATDLIPRTYKAVGCYYNPRTKFRHFVAINPDKTVVFDPIENSVTVREGYLESLRLYRPK